jgi:hypothetical protein
LEVTTTGRVKPEAESLVNQPSLETTLQQLKTAASQRIMGAKRPDPAGAPSGAASIASVATFDPDGDREENDDEAVLAISDGDPSTSWRTVCYGGEYMGGKVGVGLVVTLDQPAQQALTVDVINGPYIVDFYTSSAESAPGELSNWDGQLGAQRFATEGEVLQTDVPAAPVRHVLVLLKQLGADTSCSDNNPYRGRLGEIALVG